MALKESYIELLELQATDSDIDALKLSIENIDEKIKFNVLKNKVIQNTRQKKTLDEAALVNKRALDKINGDLEFVNQKISKEEQRLFSGSISNPKELAAIEAEVASLNKKRDDIETLVLDQMDKNAIVEDEVAQINKLIDEDTQNARALKKIWDENEKELTASLELLVEKRNIFSQKIDTDLLLDYNDLRETKHGVGVGALVNGICQVCNVELPATELENILGKDEPEFCPSCGRILIVKNDDNS